VVKVKAMDGFEKSTNIIKNVSYQCNVHTYIRCDIILVYISVIILLT